MRDSDAPGADAPPSVRDALRPSPPRDAATPGEGGGADASAGPGKSPRPTPPPAPKPVPARQVVPPSSKPVPVRAGVPTPATPVPRLDRVPRAPAKPGAARDTVPPGPPKPPAARDAAPPPARDLGRTGARTEPARDVKLGEETWTVRLKGAATVGSGHAGARILSVAFEGPEERADPAGTRYVLARRLEDVAEDELLSLVREVAHKPDATSGPARRGTRARGPKRRHGKGST